MAKTIFVGQYDDPEQGTTLYTKSMSDQIEHTIQLLYTHLYDTGALGTSAYADNLSDQVDEMSDTVNARVLQLQPDQLDDIFNFLLNAYFE